MNNVRVLNRKEIEKILPHRDAMLLLDQVRLEEGYSIGSYKVRGDEFFLQGHFPDNPIVPGVILCEMMGQSACLLVEEEGDFTPYFTKLDKVRFKKPVVPGQELEFKCKISSVRKPFYFIEAKGYADGQLCVSGDLAFAIVKKI